MYVAPTELSTGIQPPPAMVHLLHRSTSVPGFPVAADFPRSAPFYADTNPMLVVFNHMLHGASSLRCLDLLEPAASNSAAGALTRSALPGPACDCDDDSASFEDQMKELKDRGRRLNAFYPEWTGVEWPADLIRYDSLVHYQRDPLEQNLGQLVMDLVADNIIEAVVTSRPRLEAQDGGTSCFYQAVFPLLICQCDSKRAEEEEEEDEEEEEEEVGVDEEGPVTSWYGRSLCDVSGPGTAAKTVSKAEKDKEVLEMFQTLKISAYRKGNNH